MPIDEQLWSWFWVYSKSILYFEYQHQQTGYKKQNKTPQALAEWFHWQKQDYFKRTFECDRIMYVARYSDRRISAVSRAKSKPTAVNCKCEVVKLKRDIQRVTMLPKNNNSKIV